MSTINKVIHFEIPFDDKARAKTFYSETFGWKIDEMPQIKYIGLTTTPTDESGMPTTPGAINGGMVERTKDQPNPVITIGVESIDEHLEKVKAAGGSIVGSKGEVPGMGYYAYIKDTEGNVIGLWQSI